MQILFIDHSRIGDAVLSSGMLQALAGGYAGARATVADDIVAAPLCSPAACIERVLPIVRRRFALHWFADWRAVVGTRWDLIADLGHSAIPWLVQARRRLVRYGRNEGGEHRVVGLTRIQGLQGTQPAPHIGSTPVQRARAVELVRDGVPVLALSQTANWRDIEGLAARFAAVAARLTGPAAPGALRGARVAGFGRPGGRALAQPFIAALEPSRCIDLTGAADLPTVHACLARCTLFVGNDSGLRHTAEASGIPTVGLFGPSRSEHYGPWGKHTAMVRTPLPFEAPIGRPEYDFRNTDVLMERLEVDDVVAVGERLLTDVAPAVEL